MTGVAFGFAAARHAGQYREIDGAPFIVHPIEVGRLLRGDGQSDHVVAAGLLHDVLEKTATPTLELELEFGTGIAELVAAVSDDPSIEEYEERKRELRDRVGMPPRSWTLDRSGVRPTRLEGCGVHAKDASAVSRGVPS